MAISAADVKALRDRTNMPMMECKAALTEAGGDMEKAVEILRKRSKDAQDKKGARETAEGRIGLFIDPARQVGAILELRCESAPVAKGEHFVRLANDLARHIAVHNPRTVEELLGQPFVDDAKLTVNDRLGELVGLIRENMKPARFARLTGNLGGYCHHDGSVGVLLRAEAQTDAELVRDVSTFLTDRNQLAARPGAAPGAHEQLLRDVSMHIAARNPVAARQEDVPAAVLDKEKEIARAQIQADPKNAKKPANILDKIIEGKIKTWLAENVLTEQPFVKDDSKTVGELLRGQGLKPLQFVRYRVGEVGA